MLAFMIDQESSDYVGNFKKQKQKHFPCLKKRKGKKNLDVLGMFVDIPTLCKIVDFYVRLRMLASWGSWYVLHSQIIGYYRKGLGGWSFIFLLFKLME